MLPPVRPNVSSMSTGLRICRSITDEVKPGAYRSTMAKHRSAKSSLTACVHGPSFSLYGAYCTNIDIRCFPDGAMVESSDEGRQHSTTGSFDG